MIKKEYLSEVEQLYVQREAVVDEVPPRVFAIWAEVGKDVHGFVAVRKEIVEERSSDFVIQFSAVTDITVLKYHTKKSRRSIYKEDPEYNMFDEYAVDYRKRSPEDLAALLTGASKWRDEELMCSEEPSIGEDVTI